MIKKERNNITISVQFPKKEAIELRKSLFGSMRMFLAGELPDAFEDECVLC